MTALPNQAPPEIPGETPRNALPKEVRLYRYDGGKGMDVIRVRTTDKLREALVEGYRKKPPPEFVQELLDWQVDENLASLLFDGEGNPQDLVNPDISLGKIATRVMQDYEIDEQSRHDWLEKAEKATELAMQIMKVKNTPWPGAANVKYPLITTACLQYGARAYGEVIKGAQVVKAKTTGDDPDGAKARRAKRVGEFISWQLLDETDGWEEGMDMTVHVLPNKGKFFKHPYWCHIEKKLVIEHIHPENLVVHNDAVNLLKARRVTHKFRKFANEAQEYMRMEMWREVDLGEPEGKLADEDAPHDFLEQACWFDLDGDGYDEPYCVTVHPATQEVMRIVARWEPEGIVWDDEKVIKIKDELEYVDYTFLPAPDGSFYGMGYGTLQGPVNETVNTIINQLIDAGTLANAGGGFITTRARLPSGEIRISPGVWQKVEGMSGQDIKDNIVPYPVNMPSPVLYQLLDLLILGAKEMSSTGQLMTGMGQAQNINPTVILAMLEQGLKVYSTIHKRLYRSLQREFRMIYKLNARYLNPELYQRVLDSGEAIQQADFRTNDLDILPVADPSISTEAVRMMKFQALLPFLNDEGIHRQVLLKGYVDGVDLDEGDRIVKTQDEYRQEKAPMAALQVKMLQLRMQSAALELQAKQSDIAAKAADVRKTLAETTNLDAKTLGEIADAFTASIKEGDKPIEMPKVAEIMKLLETKEEQEANSEGPSGGMGEAQPQGQPVAGA